MTTPYKSDVIYERAVWHYYTIAYVASVSMCIPLALAGIASHVDGRWILVFLACEQNISWIVIGGLMCGQFKLLSTPPTPQRTVQSNQTNVTGKTGVTEIERIKVIERQQGGGV